MIFFGSNFVDIDFRQSKYCGGLIGEVEVMRYFSILYIIPITAESYHKLNNGLGTEYLVLRDLQKITPLKCVATTKLTYHIH